MFSGYYKSMKNILKIFPFFFLFCFFASGKVKKFDEVSSVYKIHIEYPAAKTKQLQNEIETTIKKYVYEFKKESKRISKNWKYTLYIKGKRYVWGNIESYYFQIYRFTGGAHGNTDIVTFVFDRKKSKFLNITDITEKIDFEKIKKYVRKKLKEKLIDAGSSGKWIEEGTEKISDFKHFVISDGKIIFFFPQYQVACYAAGIQKVEMPFPTK